MYMQNIFFGGFEHIEQSGQYNMPTDMNTCKFKALWMPRRKRQSLENEADNDEEETFPQIGENNSIGNLVFQFDQLH